MGTVYKRSSNEVGGIPRKRQRDVLDSPMEMADGADDGEEGESGGSYRDGIGNVHPMSPWDRFAPTRRRSVIFKTVRSTQQRLDFTKEMQYMLPYQYLPLYIDVTGRDFINKFVPFDKMAMIKRLLDAKVTIEHQGIERKSIVSSGGSNTEVWEPANDMNLIIGVNNNITESVDMENIDVYKPSTGKPSNIDFMAGLKESLEGENYTTTEVPTKHKWSYKPQHDRQWRKEEMIKKQNTDVNNVWQYIYMLPGTRPYGENLERYDKTEYNYLNTTYEGVTIKNAPYITDPYIGIGCPYRKDTADNMKFVSTITITWEATFEFMLNPVHEKGPQMVNTTAWERFKYGNKKVAQHLPWNFDHQRGVKY